MHAVSRETILVPRYWLAFISTELETVRPSEKHPFGQQAGDGATRLVNGNEPVRAEAKAPHAKIYEYSPSRRSVKLRAEK